MIKIVNSFAGFSFAFCVSLLFLIGWNGLNTSLEAQTATKILDLKGLVVDAKGETIVGASLMLLEDRTRGVQTDEKGEFTMTNVPANGTLKVFFIGMKEKDVKINGRNFIKIVLQDDKQVLDGVVVTALGIKREKRSLGYAIQEIKGDALSKTREVNISNSLSGKVAGLQVIKGGGGIAGSSKIVLRGNSSLTGDNQPLIVVDGVPMDNFTGASNNDFWNPSLDMGNGLGDLNPNDIESMSVLKGASAAALYGSRAGNGVILITTKNGAKNKGLGVNFTSSTGIETYFMLPHRQKEFGQGTAGIYAPDGVVSWGPKIESQLVTKWNGQQAKLANHNNFKLFLRPGVNTQNSVALSRSIGEKSTIYASITHSHNQSMTPGSKLNRLNMISRFTSRFGANEAWTIDAKVQYIRTKANNRPVAGNRVDNFYKTLINLPSTVDLRDLAAGVNDNGKHLWYATEGLNPYWASKFYNNEDQRDRFLLSGLLKYQFTPWLSAELRGGSDLYTTESGHRLNAYGPVKANGSYSQNKDTFKENNLSFLFTASQDDLLGEFGFNGTFGGNMMDRTSSHLGVIVGELEVPNLFSLNNAKGKPSISEGYSRHLINSLYGTFQINYARMIYLDITGRNDWSSTLSRQNRSFFYPSISTSFILSDLLRSLTKKELSWLTFAKLRGSWASVGNDLGPYQLFNAYVISQDPNGNTIAGKNDIFFDSNVKNELINSAEIGLEARFLDDRIGFDFALYKSNAINQLLNLPVNSLKGYKFRKINAGNIQNAGFELMMNFVPLRSNSFNWDITANISKNVNRVIDLGNEVTQYSLGSMDALSILAAKGELYGSIYGSKIARVEDIESEFYGKVIVDKNGIPEVDSKGAQYLGSQQATLLTGLTNTFTYKNLSISMQIDGRFGGKMFSFTQRSLKLSGNAAVTAPNGQREDIIYDGVVFDPATKTYSKNTKAVGAEKFWATLEKKGSENIGIVEENLYDATNIRIRNISVNYAFPKQWFKNSLVKGVNLGFSINNLAMLYSKMGGIDPESVYATGTNAVGFELFSPPTTRNYYFNLGINF